MKTGSVILILILLLFSSSSVCQNTKSDQKDPKVTFARNDAAKRVDVFIGDKIFTSYIWPDNVYKPVLYPLTTSRGTEITRGFPLKPREGERNDHIHQVGMWLNYGIVNGHDFWGNGYRGIKEPNGGIIKHLAIKKTSGGKGEGIMVTNSSWTDPAGKELMSEKTEYHFIARGNLRMIDRITSLTAGDTAVYFKDTKEGMFGIRVARQLELPVNEKVVLLDANGNPSKEKVNAGNGATGNYRSSEGISGEAVWGTRAKWMDLYGNIKDEKISLIVCDHPKNPAYPTYWHARGYGLFAANPFGWKDFTAGKETLNFTLQPGKTITFRYRIIINSGAFMSDNEINSLYKEFAEKY